MKRMGILLLVMLLLFAQTVSAEILTIDLDTASDAEIADAIRALQEEKIERSKRSISPAKAPDSDDILFRGVPWYSTRAETEAIIGYTSSTKGPNDLYRMSGIDYDSVTSGKDRVDDYGGCMASYSKVSVAGLTPSKTCICYLYPIVNGEIIEDDSLAQIYFGYYKFSSGDFGDHQAIYDEFQRKLNTAYGIGTETSDKYHTTTKWTDAKGNYIQLLINDKHSYVALGYMAADADQRLDEMQTAINNRMADKDRMTMQEQENNYDGL